MAEILSLAHARRKRSEAWRENAENAVMHPALRWISDGEDFAHRRTGTGDTFCGLPGPLLMAEPAVRLCRECYTVRVVPTP